MLFWDIRDALSVKQKGISTFKNDGKEEGVIRKYFAKTLIYHDCDLILARHWLKLVLKEFNYMNELNCSIYIFGKW